MKNILKNILTGCIFIATLSSCSDEWLDIIPKDLIIEEEFWKSRQQLEEAVAGCYMEMLVDEKISGDDKKLNGVVKQMILWGELRADNVAPSSNAVDDENKIATCNIIPSNPFCHWKHFYSVINNCNLVLENAGLVKNHDKTISDKEIDAYKAEALAIRSLMYFYLVRTYKEAPLILTPSKTNEQNYYVSKSGEQEILNQIVLDLNTAYNNAIAHFDQNSAYNRGRFNKTSVAALLADVYLWMERYQDCIDACNTVMTDKNVVFLKDSYAWDQIFKKGNSNESIFELQYGNNTNGKMNSVLFQCYGSTSKSAHLVAPTDSRNWNLLSIFNENPNHPVATDRRILYSLGISDPASISTTTNPIFKFPDSEQSAVNWILYRLSDIYLMKAEALVQQDFDKNAEEALRLVNQTYMRAHDMDISLDSLTVGSYNDKQKMADLILRERQREFLYEGKRWYDLLRTSRREKDNPMRVFNEFILPNVNSSYRVLAEGKFKNEWARYLPVPLSDMESNPNMKQNPFYDTGITKK